MNMNHLITANQSNFRTIKVRLRSDVDKLHTYKAPSDLDLSAGSTVVIQKPGGPAPGTSPYRTAPVVSVDPIPDIDYGSDIDYKWVVGVVDDTRYLNQLEEEKETIRTLHLLEAESKRKEYLQLAKENNPEMVKALENLK